MKILLLNYEFPPLGGGAGNATLYLLKEFSKHKNIEIDLVTSSTGEYQVKKFSSNISVHYLNIQKGKNFQHQTNRELLLYSWKAYQYCRKLVKDKKYDLIHAFFGIPCGIIASKLGLPYIISLRGSDVPGHNENFNKVHQIFGYWEKKAWQNACSVITNSEDLKRTAVMADFRHDIDVIENGVDCNFFKPVKQRKKRENKIKILTVGRLNKIKNINLIITALKGLDASLTIVGNGPELENLKLLTAKLNLQNKVKFLGQQPQEKLQKIYQCHDVFVLVSKNEGMSNTLLEAMSSGLPVVVTRTGGSTKLVQGNGFIVNAKNKKELQKALSVFITNREKVEKMAEISRKLSKDLSWKKVAESYLNVYSHIVPSTAHGQAIVNILHLIDSIALGGAQRVLEGILKLKSTYFRQSAIALRKRANQMVLDQTLVCESSKRFSIAPLLMVKREIVDNQVKILHCHLLRSQIFGWIIKSFFARDTILVFHEHGGILQKKIHCFLLKMMRSKVDLFIAVSKRSAQMMELKAKIPNSKIRILPNFTIYENSAKIKGHKLNKTKVTLGFIGRLDKVKGCRYLLESISKLQFKPQVLIAGDGREMAMLKKIVIENKIKKQVIFLGYVKDVSKIYQQIDILVMPSISEGSPMVLFEAQSFGIPVVGSDAPGISECILSGENGLIFKRRDCNDLAGKLNQLWSDSSLYDKISRRSLIDAQKHTLKIYQLTLKRIYYGLVSRKRLLKKISKSK